MLTPRPIRTKEDFQLVYSTQAIIVWQAQAEMIHAADAGFTMDGNLSDPKAYVAAESKLLEKYARYPTLTEYQEMPSLAAGEKWGATFGVAALVGCLVLASAKRALRTDEDLKGAYVRFLIALDKSDKRIEIDAIDAVFAVLSEQFGILWAREDALQLTVVGRRVLLHLMDAEFFVREMAEHAARLQPEISSKP